MVKFEAKSGKYLAKGLPLEIHGPLPVDDEWEIILLIYYILQHTVTEDLIRVALRNWLKMDPPEKWIISAKEKLVREAKPFDPFEKRHGEPTMDLTLDM